MKEFELTITDENGLHARPAGIVVKVAKKFTSAVTIQAGEKECDMKKPIKVMGLGVVKGDVVKVTVTGEDEEEAAEVIEADRPELIEQPESEPVPEEEFLRLLDAQTA